MIQQFSLSSGAERRRAMHMLQSLLVAELLGTPDALFLALTSWEEAVVVDNTHGGFSTLCPDWPRGPVRLSAIVLQFLRRGREVHILGPVADAPFVDRLRREVERLGLDGLHCRDVTSTESAICSARFSLDGDVESLLSGAADGRVRFQADPSLADVRCRNLREAE
ncbi:MAG: hypothetical protein EP330_08710 [Deltaproteobacteria bacterium]|nr:MAG: hypothetical protein EP330_08710 [Deltaproteobacteria bacterium]